jgi:cytochrome c oxidase subunit II
MEHFAPFPGGASSLAVPFDTLFFSLLTLCSLVALSIVCLIIFFAVKYRLGSKARRAQLRPAKAIEFAWTLIPLGIFLIIFLWAASLYTQILTPPPGEALEISVVGKQWMWKLQHPEGKQEINELHVPRGSSVRLTMISRDVIHSFFIPAFRIKHDVLPGRYTKIWFSPLKTGEYYLFCAEYCGTDHSRMGGRVVVMEPAAYKQWLER